jgi:RND superfamily putative drug exporter
MRFVVLGVWLAATIGLTVLAGAVGGEAEDDYALPGSESERASAILREGGFSFGGGTQAQLVLQRDGGLDHPAARAVVDELVAQVRQAAPDARVSGPFEDDTHHQVSEDGEIAFIAVDLPEQDPDDFAALAEELDDIRESFSGESLRVELGGLTLEQEAESGPPSELVGVLAAVVILLFAFGSVFAMALPILVGVMGAASGVAGVGLAARWVEMPTFAAPVAAMIAIGVGVDYALLVVTRYREGLSAGLPTADAIVVAQTTAGRSVIFAGVTVVIASLGLVLMDLKLITGVALGIAGSVLITMLAAVALLPALMAIVGHRIDKFSVRRRRAHHDGGPARRWSHQVQKHPLPWALGATTLLILLSIPTLDMRLGFSDAGTNSTRDTSRRAYDLLADGFGPGSNGPLVVAARGDADSAPAYEQLADALGQTEGVAQVSPPIVSADGSVALVQVVPETGPRDAETTDLVHHLRDEVVSAVAGKSLSEVAVGGATAAAVDFADYNTERLPIFLTVVLGLALLLLMAVFRGFPVAVKAVVVNLLSIGASFGVTVAVFQWGWGVDLLDLGAAGPFEAWAPMMLIAIVFGLSMDYEVFLLSRIREEYERTGDNADAVAQGLAQTARVITAAAAIMVCVFGSFVLGSSRELQLFGFGLASAVLIDATVVRLVLVPAVMELLGDRNWWLPPWLNRTLPHLRIEASEREPVDA